MKHTLPLLVCVLVLAFPETLPAQRKGAGERIEKCQDAEGRWHYGEHAAAECARDKAITTINERGLKLKEQAPPPTVEELQARKEAQERKKEEERKAAAQRAADQRLLFSYDSEEALLQARDSQLNSLDAVLRGNRKLLESRYAQRAKLLQQLLALQGKDAETALKQLDTIKTEIAEFEAATASREGDRARIVERFAQELERYRELKGTASSTR